MLCVDACHHFGSMKSPRQRDLDASHSARYHVTSFICSDVSAAFHTPERRSSRMQDIHGRHAEVTDQAFGIGHQG